MWVELAAASAPVLASPPLPQLLRINMVPPRSRETVVRVCPESRWGRRDSSSKVVSCLRESEAEQHREGGGASTAAPEEGANEQVGGGGPRAPVGDPLPPVLGLCLLSIWGVVLGPAEFRFPRLEGGVIVALRRLLQGLGTGLVGGALPHVLPSAGPVLPRCPPHADSLVAPTPLV